jgi:putative ABC transport system permease protein
LSHWQGCEDPLGIRLAVGSEPRRLVTDVIGQGVGMALVGVAAGALGGFAPARLAGTYFEIVRMPGAWPVAGSAVVLLGAAVFASVVPALRAPRVDITQVLRSE